jgi:DNA polymerase III subunit chi
VTDVFFYHLQNQPLEIVLPLLLTKTLERGWTAVVESTNPQRITMLDEHLWVYTDESFLPHSLEQEPDAAHEPIVLTTSSANINSANVRFLIDGAALPADSEAYERIILMFDGKDEDALRIARAHWKDAKARGMGVTYWQQNNQGTWEKKA